MAKTEAATTEETASQPHEMVSGNPPSREELRKAALNGVKPKVVPVKIGGVEAEWRQPTMQQVQEYRDREGEGNENKNFMILMLVAFTYVIGTDERLFEDEDYIS